MRLGDASTIVLASGTYALDEELHIERSLTLRACENRLDISFTLAASFSTIVALALVACPSPAVASADAAPATAAPKSKTKQAAAAAPAPAPAKKSM